jgi:hypothetical protein
MTVRLMTAALCLSLFVSPEAMAEGRKKIRANKADDDYALSVIGSNGEKFTMEQGYVLGHGNKADYPIRVRLEGSGTYSAGAIKAVKGKDWFPGNSNLDEVRFVCTLERGGGMRPRVHVVFPTQSELESGKGARVEIPCALGAEQVKFAMVDVQKLLQDQLNHPDKTARESVTLAKNCNKRPRGPGCIKWTEILEVFSGDAKAALPAAAQYCNVSFNAGVSASAQPAAQLLSLKTSTANPNAFEFDLDEELDSGDQAASDELQTQLENWAKKELGACQRQSSSSPLADCWSAIDKVKERLLREKKIRILSPIDVKMDGQYCSLNRVACLVAHKVAQYENWAINSEASKAIGPVPKYIENLGNNDAGKLLELARLHVGTLILVKDADPETDSGKTTTYSNPDAPAFSSGCGRDVACEAQVQAVEAEFSRQMSVLPGGCYLASSVALAAQRTPKFVFSTQPAEVCAKRFPYG